MKNTACIGLGAAIIVGAIILIFLLKPAANSPSQVDTPIQATIPQKQSGMADESNIEDIFDDKFVDETAGSIKKADATAYLDGEIQKAESSLEVCKHDKTKYKGCLNRLDRLKSLREKMR